MLARALMPLSPPAELVSLSPERSLNSLLVRAYYADAHPGLELELAREGGSPWSKGRALNEAVRELDPAVGLLVLNDADTIVPPAQLTAALELAAAGPGLVFAYSHYHRLGAAATVTLNSWREALEAPPELSWSNPHSHGCVVMRRASFEYLGGFNERFEGWGYEDVEFNERAERLWPHRRVDGHAFHLWHGARRGDDSPEDQPAELVARNLELLSAARSARA